MYCVKCGVRLQDGVGECPLCHTAVWMPEETLAEKNYPDTLPQYHRETNLPYAVAMTILSVLVSGVILAVCFKLYGALRWGGYAIGGVGLFYVAAVLPAWFRRPMGEIFVPADHVALALYALYVCLATSGHWFLSFAFPVIGISCLLSTGMICLLKYVRRGRIFIFGGFLILMGGCTMLVEFFEHITFGTQMFRWSLYSISGFAAVGLFLLAASTVRPLRRALEKRFFF
ncbi:MAG: hypothetical protein IJU18_01035 [Oscillospiraceae bacterium]|nr:hypothetical protein [Oscillospiraceae bacterium]